jgi:magnesium and cobalt exporter, CNNM family
MVRTGLRASLARTVARAADGVIRLLGESPSAGREEITEDELRDLVAANTVLHAAERRLIDDVLSAGRRPIREVMVPRTEVLFLAGSLTVSRALRLVRDVEHSRYPVTTGSHDDVTGYVRMRDLLMASDTDRTVTVDTLARPIKHLPTSKRLVAALSELRREGYPMAVVVDEYGGTAGIVTMEDLVEELVGEIRDDLSAPDPAPGTATELDGLTNLADVAERTGLLLPSGPYETLGGYVMATLGRLPRHGDTVPAAGWQLTVTSLDGRRAHRIALTPPSPPPLALPPAPARPALPAADRIGA